MKTITISDQDFKALERVVSNSKNMMLYMTEHFHAVDICKMCEDANVVVKAFGLYKNN